MYTDPILKAYVDMINTATNNKFKGVYYGDPLRVPVSKLPALIVSKRATGAGQFTNAEDQHKAAIVFTVITDIRKDINENNNSIVAGTNTLYDIMEGRDPASYQLKPTSLLYILRHNLDVNRSLQLFTDISQDTRVDYGLTIGKRAEDSFGVEGSISIVASFIQVR